MNRFLEGLCCRKVIPQGDGRRVGGPGLVGILLFFGLLAGPSLLWSQEPGGSGEGEEGVVDREVVSPQGLGSTALGQGSLSDAEALREGNRLFALGELEAALVAYEAGYEPTAPHPTLVYNLATTLHHLDRLPEAILWYRRGAAEDPWLQENLWLARRSLGSQSLSLKGMTAFLAQRSGWVFALAVALAWFSALAAMWSSRIPRRAWATALVLSLVFWIGSWLMGRYGPAEAVLLADCTSLSGEIPAGTELWLWPSEGETLTVAGFTETRCPKDAVSWIKP